MKDTAHRSAQQIAEWLSRLLEPGQVVELRALNVVEQYGTPKTFSGFFDTDHLAEFATAAVELSERSKGVYWTLNPVNPDLLARRANRVARADSGDTTSDRDILRRRLLLIDCDPKRPAGISATDEEKELARQVAIAVDAFLCDAGWPAPIMADSGNGSHLDYLINLPADDGGLVKRCLLALAQQFDTDRVSIDTAVFNPSRICKLYGTMARKGDSIPTRPHRMSKIINIPDELTTVPIELLEQLAAQAPAEAKPHNGNGQRESIPRASLPSGDVRERARRYLATIPPAVAGEHGHDQTFHAACRIVQGFDLSVDDALPLLAEWNACCQPPWNEQELRHKVEDASTQPGPRGELLNAAKYNLSSELTNGQAKPSAGSLIDPATFKLDLITSGEFAAASYRQHFLIKRVLVEGQPCVLGGPKKTLKTSLLVDLALSLGTGTQFLGHESFIVSEPVNVVLLSGESGNFTLQQTARRIAETRGRSLSEARVWWGFNLPQLAQADHLAELAKNIREHGIKVAIIDPAYLCLLAGDTNSNITANVFAMGRLLRGLTDIGRDTGCTLIIAHHTRKSDRLKPFGVPDLEDLSGSGFAEWARQWILLNRREPFQAGTGEHRLWLNVGGSAGHSGTWALDISEGTIDERGGGRTWCVSIVTASDAIQVARDSKEQNREREKQEKAKRDADRIRDVLRKASEPLAKTKLRDTSGINSGQFNAAFSILVENHEVESVEFKGANKKTYIGFVLKTSATGQPDKQPDSPACPVVRLPAESNRTSVPLIGGTCPCPVAPDSVEHQPNLESVRLQTASPDVPANFVEEL